MLRIKTFSLTWKNLLNLFSLIKQIRRGFCDRKNGIFSKNF
ncbi:hypothetical protein HM1_2912 [Heliomicrobium modesticaldum Ice1]|uniref:Uncharacterized protein n=1 Tax=Heliobacterium modesticaldum (strain ATCC 51547 / Ice1) TaxID=498761 RepID=B0TCX0_HELMI|nr:hypothetical protein HM1_2912 [Heliomicrobium modesticaldum Ice1]